MGMRKYADAEQAKVVSPQEHAKIAAGVAKLGKTSASQLTDAERKRVLDS